MLRDDQSRKIAELRKTPEYAIIHRNEQGWHNPSWREARIQEAAQQGHVLGFIGASEECAKTDSILLRFSCSKCKRVIRDTTPFVNEKCKPSEYPKDKFWYQLRVSQPSCLPRLVKFWGWGRKQVAHIDALALKPSKRRLVPRQELDPITHSQWVADLTEQGVEPNPGPRGRSLRKLDMLNVISLNTQGEPGAWRILNSLGTNSSHHMVFLQELNMNADQFAVFCQAAGNKGWVPFFRLGRPSNRAPVGSHVGGVCTLVKKGLQCHAWYPDFSNGEKFWGSMLET